MNVPDNYDLFASHQAKEDAWLEKRPTCDSCKYPIQDDTLYDIDGAIYCPNCNDKLFLKRTENYER